MTHTTEGRHLSLLPLYACAFGITVSNSMIFPALSDLQDKYGFSAAGLGFIAASGFLASLLVQLFLAPYADRGHPKRLVMLGLILAAVGALLFAFGTSLPVFIVGRSFAGASLGSSGPAIRAIVANMDKARAAERLGRLRGIELSGFTGGPLIGALLIGPLGLRGAFLLFGSIAVITLVAVSTQQLPALPSTAESRRNSFGLLRIRQVRAAALASMTLFLPVGIYDALWDRYITDRGGNNFQVGLTFLLYTIPFMLLAPRSGRMADRRGPALVAVVGIFLMAPLVWVYGLLSTPELLVGFAIVEGIIGSMNSPSVQSWMARVAPHGRASAAQGLMSSADLLAATMMSLLAPALYGAYGPAFTFGFAAVLMVVFGTVVALMIRGTDIPPAT